MVGTKHLLDYANTLDRTPHDTNDPRALWDIIKSRIMDIASQHDPIKKINDCPKPVWLKRDE